MTQLLTFADAERVLAQRLPRYEPRPQQQDLAAAIETEFFGGAYQNQILVSRSNGDEVQAPRAMFAHAPTGLGKSMAYLIPAILSGKRVIVSVTTKALQDQLAEQDLPFLREHLGEFTWAVLKGRSNYLCLNRAADAEDVPGLDRLLAWVRQNPTTTGLREDLPFVFEDRHWAMICGHSEDCTAADCKDTPNQCFIYGARERAKEARIVVVNHSLYFTDLQIGAKTEFMVNLLGQHEWVIFDEAHEVHEVASSSLSTDLTVGSFMALAGNVRSWMTRYSNPETLEHAGEPLAALLRNANALLESVPTAQFAGGTFRIRGQHLEAMGDPSIALLDALDALDSHLASAITFGDVDQAAKRRKSLRARIGRLAEALTTLLTADLSEVVRWTEVSISRGQRRVTLRMAPVDISGYLHDHLFSRTATLMVSATLAVDGKFDFQAKQLGVANHYGKIVGTPFDYKRNTRLYVPLTIEAPANVRVWENQASNEIRNLINAAEGRTLVLFTSIAHMRRTYESIANLVDYPIKMQGQESIKALKDWFLGSNDTVLFGTRSFMTGFDARGEACSMVIITKMPFPVPDEPLTEARCEVIERRGGSPFAEYSVPVMSLVLQQAAGRLMRHTTDQGVVAILDHRIVSKGYGKKVLRDLPPMTLTHEPREVQSFLASTREYYAGAGA